MKKIVGLLFMLIVSAALLGGSVAAAGIVDEKGSLWTVKAVNEENTKEKDEETENKNKEGEKGKTEEKDEETGNENKDTEKEEHKIEAVVKLRKGHKEQLPIKLKGSLKWKTADKKTATVSRKGVVKGISKGKTEVTVTNGKKSLIYEIRITPQVIVIDAGHQAQGNSDLEPIGPGASTKKPKVSSGTSGCVTGLAEYKLNLTVAKNLKKELVKEGYKVIMVRTKHDVNISNSKRAEIANKAKADVFIRIHANSSTDSSVNGVLTISPTSSNPYCKSIYKECYTLSKCVVDSVSETTGARNAGIWQTDTMSGINWCKVPVTILEMGFMSNPTEDRNLSKDNYQNKIVKGTVKGINKYLGN